MAWWDDPIVDEKTGQLIEPWQLDPIVEPPGFNSGMQPSPLTFSLSVPNSLGGMAQAAGQALVPFAAGQALAPFTGGLSASAGTAVQSIFPTPPAWQNPYATGANAFLQAQNPHDTRGGWQRDMMPLPIPGSLMAGGAAVPTLSQTFVPQPSIADTFRADMGRLSQQYNDPTPRIRAEALAAYRETSTNPAAQYSVVPRSQLPDLDQLTRAQRDFYSNPANIALPLPAELRGAFDLGDGQALVSRWHAAQTMERWQRDRDPFDQLRPNPVMPGQLSDADRGLRNQILTAGGPVPQQLAAAQGPVLGQRFQEREAQRLNAPQPDVGYGNSLALGVDNAATTLQGTIPGAAKYLADVGEAANPLAWAGIGLQAAGIDNPIFDASRTARQTLDRAVEPIYQSAAKRQQLMAPTIAEQSGGAFNPTSLKWWLIQSPQAIASLGPTLAATALGGPGAGYLVGAAMEAGGSYMEVRQALEEQGVPSQQADATARSVAAVVGTIGGALEAAAAGELLTERFAKQGLRGFAKNLLIDALAEGGTEVLQEINGDMARQLATGVPLEANWQQYFAAGLLGSAIGGAVGSIKWMLNRAGQRVGEQLPQAAREEMAAQISVVGLPGNQPTPEALPTLTGQGQRVPGGIGGTPQFRGQPSTPYTPQPIVSGEPSIPGAAFESPTDSPIPVVPDGGAQGPIAGSPSIEQAQRNAYTWPVPQIEQPPATWQTSRVFGGPTDAAAFAREVNRETGRQVAIMPAGQGYWTVAFEAADLPRNQMRWMTDNRTKVPTLDRSAIDDAQTTPTLESPLSGGAADQSGQLADSLGDAPPLPPVADGLPPLVAGERPPPGPQPGNVDAQAPITLNAGAGYDLAAVQTLLDDGLTPQQLESIAVQGQGQPVIAPGRSGQWTLQTGVDDTGRPIIVAARRSTGAPTDTGRIQPAPMGQTDITPPVNPIDPAPAPAGAAPTARRRSPQRNKSPWAPRQIEDELLETYRTQNDEGTQEIIDEQAADGTDMGGTAGGSVGSVTFYKQFPKEVKNWLEGREKQFRNVFKKTNDRSKAGGEDAMVAMGGQDAYFEWVERTYGASNRAGLAEKFKRVLKWAKNHPDPSIAFKAELWDFQKSMPAPNEDARLQIVSADTIPPGATFTWRGHPFVVQEDDLGGRVLIGPEPLPPTPLDLLDRVELDRGSLRMGQDTPYDPAQEYDDTAPFGPPSDASNFVDRQSINADTAGNGPAPAQLIARGPAFTRRSGARSPGLRDRQRGNPQNSAGERPAATNTDAKRPAAERRVAVDAHIRASLPPDFSVATSPDGWVITTPTGEQIPVNWTTMPPPGAVSDRAYAVGVISNQLTAERADGSLVQPPNTIAEFLAMPEADLQLFREQVVFEGLYNPADDTIYLFDAYADEATFDEEFFHAAFYRLNPRDQQAVTELYPGVDPSIAEELAFKDYWQRPRAAYRGQPIGHSIMRYLRTLNVFRTSGQPRANAGYRGSARRSSPARATAEPQTAEQKADDQLVEDWNEDDDGLDALLAIVRPPTIARIKPAPLPGGGRKQLKDIILDFEKALGKQVRTARPHRNALGTYYPGSTRTVIRYANDLDTTAHEIAHFLDDKFGLVGAWAVNRARSPFDAELIPNFSGYGSVTRNGPRSKLAYQRAEGVAEWIRAYIVNPQAAAAAAPRFHAHYLANVTAPAKAAVKAFSDDVRRFAGLPAVDQALGNVEMQRPPTLKRLLNAALRRDKSPHQFEITWVDRVRTKLQDDLTPVQKAQLALLEMRHISPDDLRPSEDPILLARLLAGATGKFDQMLETGLVDAKGRQATPGGIDWLLQPLAQEPAAFQRDMDATIALLLSERVEEKALLLAQEADEKINELLAALPPGQPVPPAVQKRIDAIRAHYRNRMGRLAGFGGGIFADDQIAQQAIADIKADPQLYARAAEAARRYRQWADTALRYMVDRGRLSQQSYEQIKAKNQQYAAMHRAMDELDRGALVGSSLAAVDEPVQKFKGSTRQIRHPYANLIETTQRMYHEADRNQVMQALRNLLTQTRAMYQGAPTDFDRIGSKAAAQDDNTIRIFVAGKVEHWQFAEPLRVALKQLDQPYRLPKLLTAIPQTTRTLITTSPGFAIRNAIRDNTERALLSDTGSKPWDVFRHQTDEDRRDFALAGGENFGHYITDSDQYYKVLGNAIHEYTQDRNVVVTNLFRLGRAYRRALQASENRSRISEFKRALAEAKTRGLSDYDAHLWAAYKARSLLDFAVAGQWIRVANQVLPFLNARIQGTVNTVRAARHGKFWGRFGMYVLLPTLVQMLASGLLEDDDDREERRQQPAWRRDLFWSWKLGETRIYIPRPYETGVLAGGMERLWDYYRGDKHAMEGYPTMLLANLLPFDETIVGGPFGAFIEVMTNHSFFQGRHIISPFEKGKDMSLRDTARASRLAHALAPMVRLLHEEYSDPRYIDHLLQRIGGGNYSLLRAVTDVGRSDKPRGGWFDPAIAASGVVSLPPATTARDYQWVMNEAKRVGDENSREIRGLQDLVRSYWNAPTFAERNRVAKLLREAGTELRKHYEAESGNLLQERQDRFPQRMQERRQYAPPHQPTSPAGG